MYPEKFLFSYQNYEILPVIENWQFPNEFYKTPGVHEFFIHSDLDDSFVRIQIRVPQNYDPDAAYPAIIAFSTYNDGSNSGLIQEQELAEPCLCFDVTGRGFTGGSYVGEASIFEVLAWIRKSYRLDENRLYFIGQSNGGYATYALAQNHPSLPAAICPQISYPQIETVCNICNIPTYQLVSDCDRIFTGRENEVLGRLKKYGYYKQYDFKSMLHHHLSPYLTHKRLLNDLLAHHRNPYPDTVVYKTCRNRHLESYWVRLHGIERQKKYASVKAEIVDSHTIRLRVSGAYGVTVTLPPQIDRSDFRIIVNTKEFSYRSYDRPRVMLERKGTWRLTEQEGYPDYRKGTGLLDVYLKPMRIILPENASEGLSAVAEHFAHPYTNGLAPKVCVDYPVYTPSEVPDHIFSYSLILLDQAGQNPYAVRLKDRLPVQCDDAGYTYQGSRYDGDYVVMQVIPEPCDCRRSILVVSLNNESLLKRHILLRKVILPFYTTGLHGLWNNEAVIFDGKKYGCIYEAGDPIRLL